MFSSFVRRALPNEPSAFCFATRKSTPFVIAASTAARVTRSGGMSTRLSGSAGAGSSQNAKPPAKSDAMSSALICRE